MVFGVKRRKTEVDYLISRQLLWLLKTSTQNIRDFSPERGGEEVVVAVGGRALGAELRNSRRIFGMRPTGNAPWNR